jgi:hypothetical protein
MILGTLNLGKLASNTCIKPEPRVLSVGPDTFQDMENLQGFEGLSALEESAVRLHEVYKSLTAGGFTEDQALTLIAKMTRTDSDS